MTSEGRRAREAYRQLPLLLAFTCLIQSPADATQRTVGPFHGAYVLSLQLTQLELTLSVPVFPLIECVPLKPNRSFNPQQRDAAQPFTS